MRNVRDIFSKLQIPLKRFTSINTARFNSNSVDYGEEDVDEQLYKLEKCINEVHLLGRVRYDPVVSEKNGKPFIKFTVGTNKLTTDFSAPSLTDWHTVFTFSPTLIKSVRALVKKGKRVYISGKLSYITDVTTSKSVTGVMLSNLICFS